jgi:small-conductance mechanosensitive channel
MDITQTYTLLDQWANGGTSHLIIVGVGIIVVTAVISHAVTVFIRHIVQLDGVPLPSSSILVNIARITLWCLGIALMLSICFNVDVNALVAALGVGGIALSLGLQDTIKNFIGGLQVTVMRIVEPGDHIVVGAVEGIVHDVSWRQTVVTDFENVTHIIPNSVINATSIGKVEPSNTVSTLVVLNNDGRDIDELLREMEEKARLAVQAVAPLEKDPWILVTQIGEYGTWAKLRFVMSEPVNVREARDAALRAIAPYTRNNAADMLPDGQVRNSETDTVPMEPGYPTGRS